MQKSASALGIATIFLAACAQPYVQPEGPDTASLTFVNLSHTDIEVLGFKVAENCSGGKLFFHKERQLFPGEQLAIAVAPNQLFSFSFMYHTASRYCFMPATFTPKQGGRYIARFTARRDKCYSSFAAIINDDEEKDPSFRPRKWRTPVWESGSFCE